MPELKTILEAVLLAAGEPLPLERLQKVFPEAEQPEREALRAALALNPWLSERSLLKEPPGQKL